MAALGTTQSTAVVATVRATHDSAFHADVFSVHRTAFVPASVATIGHAVITAKHVPVESAIGVSNCAAEQPVVAQTINAAVRPAEFATR